MEDDQYKIKSYEKEGLNLNHDHMATISTVIFQRRQSTQRMSRVVWNAHLPLQKALWSQYIMLQKAADKAGYQGHSTSFHISSFHQIQVKFINLNKVQEHW